MRDEEKFQEPIEYVRETMEKLVPKKVIPEKVYILTVLWKVGTKLGVLTEKKETPIELIRPVYLRPILMMLEDLEWSSLTVSNGSSFVTVDRNKVPNKLVSSIEEGNSDMKEIFNQVEEIYLRDYNKLYKVIPKEGTEEEEDDVGPILF